MESNREEIEMLTDIYRVTTHPADRKHLTPMYVGQDTTVPVRKTHDGPHTVRFHCGDQGVVVGTVIAIGDDGYSANIEYVLPDGYDPS